MISGFSVTSTSSIGPSGVVDELRRAARLDAPFGREEVDRAYRRRSEDGVAETRVAAVLLFVVGRARLEIARCPRTRSARACCRRSKRRAPRTRPPPPRPPPPSRASRANVRRPGAPRGDRSSRAARPSTPRRSASRRNARPIRDQRNVSHDEMTEAVHVRMQDTRQPERVEQVLKPERRSVSDATNAARNTSVPSQRFENSK